MDLLKEQSNFNYEDIELIETSGNLSTSQKAIISAKQTIAGNHKLIGFKDSKEYAKKIWGISNKTLSDARWLVTNHKDYAEEIFEHGFVIIDGKRWSGVSGLVKMLKAKAGIEEEAGREDYAIAYKMVEDAIKSTKALTMSNMKQLKYITDKKAEEIFYEKTRDMLCDKNPFIEALKK